MSGGRIAGVVGLLVLLILIQILRRIWRGRSDAELSVRWTATQFGILLLIALTNIHRVPPTNQVDLAIYHRYSTRIFEGEVPYLEFDLEYPPLALLPMLAAQLLSFGFGTGLPAYATGFGMVIALLSTGVAVILRRIASKMCLGSAASVAYSYTLLVVVLTPLMSWRFDLFPAFLSQLALLAVLRRRPSEAGFWLGAGAAAKLYPLLLVPAFAVFYAARKESSSIIRLGMGAGIAGALFMLPSVLLAPEGFLKFLRYHELRGLELGSLPAGILMLARTLKLTEIDLVENFGATHLQASVAQGVVQALPFVFAVALLLLLLVGYHRFRLEVLLTGEVSDQSLVTLLVAVLLTCLATSKILSPQFILWLLPFTPLLRPHARQAYLLIAALTSLTYPFLYPQIREFELVPVLVLNARNLLIVGLAMWLVTRGLRVRQLTGQLT